MLLMLAALPAACTSLFREHDPLIGHWYGEDYQPVIRDKAKWLMHLRQDGTFTIIFRRYSDGKVTLEQTEAGRWSYRNGLYATLTQTINGKSVDLEDDTYHDLYLVEQLNDKEMIYKQLKTGVVFRSKKVSNDFKLP
jgi:hypothetical protein